MIAWGLVVWLWLLSGFLVWRTYAENTGKRQWIDVLGLLIIGAPIVTAKIIVEALGRFSLKETPND